MAVHYEEYSTFSISNDKEEGIRDALKARFTGNCKCSARRLWKFVSYIFPILKFLKYYKFKENILIDALTGVIIGIMHIPQAFAFGLLTSVKIENGLYTSVWPVILYVIFGTSPHVSIGTSAVICMMTASIVDREAEEFKMDNLHLLNSSEFKENGTLNVLKWEDVPEFMDFKENIAMNISLYSGCILILMGLLRLGFITMYFSVSFFSAFTSGAAVHIATSQLPALLGVKVPRFAGAFKLFHTYIEFFSRITEVEYPTLIVSAVSILMLLLVKHCVNERYKHKLPIPIPTELLIVIIATIVSYFADLEHHFSVDVVGDIPHDIPAPVVPYPSKFPHYIVDCFIVSLLIYANTIAMAKICAKKHNYEIDNNQELFAYGICNFASAFMRCFPSSVAPPRSMVASAMNVKSTVSGLFAAVLMLLVIVALTPVFKFLPNSALAAIIVVALQGLFVQMADGYRYWKINKYDFFIWLSTISGVVILDIDIGLGIGLAVSLFSIVLQSQKASSAQLWKRGGSETEITESYLGSGIKVFQFRSNLFYANAEIFRDKLYRATVHPRKFLKLLKKKEKQDSAGSVSSSPGIDDVKCADNEGFDEVVFDLPDEVETQPTNESRKLSYQNSGSHPQNFDRNDSVFTVTTDIDYRQDVTCLTDSTNYVDGLNYSVSKIYSNSICSRKTDDSGYEDEDDMKMVETKISLYRKTRCIIVDCSKINYMDVTGAGVLSHIAGEYSKVNIRFYLCGCSKKVNSVMELSRATDKILPSNIFQDLHAAVEAAERDIIADKLASIDMEVNTPIPDFTDEEAAEESYVTKL